MHLRVTLSPCHSEPFGSAQDKLHEEFPRP
jgi:hypothetical protein